MTEMMNQTVINGELRITSLEIARLTGKDHRNVLRDIRNMEPAWEKVHQLKFEQMQIREKLPNNGYRMKPVYALTMLESLYIATKYNDEARAKLVIRWAELEGKSQQEMQREVKRLETEEDILKRSDDILRDQIQEENDPARGCFTFTEIAKVLRVDRKWLIAVLRQEEVIIWVAGRYEIQPPYDKMGLEMYRHHHDYSLRGERRKDEYLVWTPEGREFVIDLVKRLLKHQKTKNYHLNY